MVFFTLMSTAIERKTLTLDSDGLTDLQIIAQRAPGKGAALQRMFDRAGVSHNDIAIDIGRHRSTVSSWVQEARWPIDDDIRKTLVMLGLDRKQLLEQWGVLLSTDVAVKDDLTHVARRIKAELDFEFDTLQRSLIIFRGLAEEILIKQGFKAREDTRSAEFFFARWDKAEEENRKRSIKDVKIVSKHQGQWATGTQVYDAAQSASSVTDTQASVNTPSSDPLQQASALASIGKPVT